MKEDRVIVQGPLQRRGSPEEFLVLRTPDIWRYTGRFMCLEYWRPLVWSPVPKDKPKWVGSSGMIFSFITISAISLTNSGIADVLGYLTYADINTLEKYSSVSNCFYRKFCKFSVHTNYKYMAKKDTRKQQRLESDLQEL